MESEITKYLEDLARSLGPTIKQREQIQTRLNGLCQILEKNLPYRNGNLNQLTYLHGSWNRGTIIRKWNGEKWDVDLLVLLGEYRPFPMLGWWNFPDRINPQSALATIRSHLKRVSQFSNMEIVQGFPTIQLRYADDFDIEIMPAYYRNWNWSEDRIHRVFCIPESKTGWKETRLFRFEKKLKLLDQRLKGRLILCIKILKYWRNTHSLPLPSILIEVLAYKFLKTINPTRSLAYLVKFWFNRAGEWISREHWWYDQFKPTFPEEDGESYFDGNLRRDTQGWFKVKNIINSTRLSLEGNLKEWQNALHA